MTAGTTVLAPDGTAVAHGCARGPYPWIPPPGDGQRHRDGRLLDEPHDSRLDVVGDPAWVGTLSK